MPSSRLCPGKWVVTGLKLVLATCALAWRSAEVGGGHLGEVEFVADVSKLGVVVASHEVVVSIVHGRGSCAGGLGRWVVSVWLCVCVCVWGWERVGAFGLGH